MIAAGFWMGLLIGLLVGAFAAIVGVGLASADKRADDEDWLEF